MSVVLQHAQSHYANLDHLLEIVMDNTWDQGYKTYEIVVVIYL